MIVTEDIFNTILENKANGTTYIFKNFCNDVPSWDEFVEYIYEASEQTSQFDDPLPQYDLDLGGKVVGNILLKQDLYLYVGLHRYIGKSEQIVNEFRTFKPMFGLANLYVNLSSKISNIPPHVDPMDNFYWQCQGSVEWLANGNTYNVEQGDLVYIPAKTSHAVNFNGPRAAIGFSVDLNG